MYTFYTKTIHTMLTQLAQNLIHNLVSKQFLRSSDWLMRSELGYFAQRLISGLNNGTVTLIKL